MPPNSLPLLLLVEGEEIGAEESNTERERERGRERERERESESE